MNAQLSRRVGRLMNVPPIVKLGPRGVYEFAVAVGAAGSYEELPENYQRLILEAEANLAQLIAEHRSGPKVAAG
jgi:hypothetical protein